MAKTVVIGLMGGMYSGKSTVASEFGRLGCAVIDGDEIAHELLGENSIKNEIVTEFGKGILGRQSEIDRQKLAAIVFGDGEKLQILCEILHPRVTERTKGLIAEYRGQGVPAVVLDMPLLVEAGLEKLCDMLVFVDCERPLRLERAVKKGVFDENQVNVRENFQFSLDKKRAIADNTVDNNSDFSVLSKQVAEIFTSLADSV